VLVPTFSVFYSQMVTRGAILLDLLYTVVSTSYLFTVLATSILLDLARVFLVAMVSGSAGALVSVLLPQQPLRLDPDPALSWW
jgi:hypothetical protein